MGDTTDAPSPSNRPDPAADAAQLSEPSVVVRPDGYYWLASDGQQEFGPFQTRAQALANRDATSESALAPIATLHEAEREIGIADWIDAETGEPAEGASPPHLPEE